jgi:hypothetical protein
MESTHVSIALSPLHSVSDYPWQAVAQAATDTTLKICASGDKH